MRRLNMDEVKAVQVSILDVVDKFCRERGINYYMEAGTLLGAVRHKGYIPWDDDIDIGMLRPDYDRFMREFNGYNPRYEFRCYETDPEFPRVFGKVFDTSTMIKHEHYNGFKSGGISIDISASDNAPDDDREAEKMYRARDFWISMQFRRTHDIFYPAAGNILRRMCAYTLRALLRLFPRTFFVEKWLAVTRRCISQDTKRVGDFMGYDYVLCSKEAFRSFIELEFEGKMYKAPIGYDELLTQHYGDYMTPPPPEKRVGHPSFTAYMKD